MARKENSKVKNYALSRGKTERKPLKEQEWFFEAEKLCFVFSTFLVFSEVFIRSKY